MNTKRLVAFPLIAMMLAFSVASAQNRQYAGGSPSRDLQRPDARPSYQNVSPDSPKVPKKLDLPTGTLLVVRTAQHLSSDWNSPGDGFTAILDQPIIAQGWVVARPGQTVLGKVTISERADRNRENSKLAVELTELTLVDGQQTPVLTALLQVSNGSSGGSWTPGKTATVASTTVLGASIGAAAGGRQGLGIGAAVGAVAGVAGAISTRGRPTELYAESVLTFRLDQPVNINTARSQQAFLPVTQDDYERRSVRSVEHNPDRYSAGRNYYPAPSAPPAAYYAPYAGGGYAYPSGYYGLSDILRYYPGGRVLGRPGYYRIR
jgi:hypothetical protein